MNDDPYAIAENDIEAAIAHYADWEGFPRFVLHPSDLVHQDLGFMSLVVHEMAERAVRLLGHEHKQLERLICDGGCPTTIVSILDDASRIVESAIEQCPYDFEITFGSLPTKRLHSPWEEVRGPCDTFSWSVAHKNLTDKSQLQHLCAALAIWAIYRARRLASEDSLDAEPYLREANKFLTIAERVDAIGAQTGAASKRGLDVRHATPRELMRYAYENIWKRKLPDEKYTVVIDRIAEWLDSLPEEIRTKGLKKSRNAADTPDSNSRATEWKKAWRKREIKGLPGMEPE